MSGQPPQGAKPAVATCAAIILFHPDAQAWHNVTVLAAQADCLLVIDNTPTPGPQPGGLPRHVYLLHNHNRGGIAGALNLAAGTAHERGFEFLAFLDQDSVVPPDLVRRMVDFCQHERADMAGPRVFETGSGVYLVYKRIHRFHLERVDTGQMKGPTPVSFMITSGSVMSLRAYRRLGGFREDFFIDHVDTEYCLRLQRAGGRLLINPDIEIRHTIGVSKVRRLTSRFKVISNRHPPWRRYFIGYNGARTSRIYLARYPVFAAWTGLIIFKEAVAIALLDEQPRPRLQALLGGYLSGWWRQAPRNAYMPKSAQAGGPRDGAVRPSPE